MRRALARLKLGGIFEGAAMRVAVFWVLCGALLLALHGSARLDSDEGVVLHGAWNLLQGRVPYTDFFEFVAPGSFYLVFAAWKLAGPSYALAKALGIAALGAAAVGVWKTSALLAREGGTEMRPQLLLFGPLALCLLSANWPAINHNTFSLALLVWCVYFLCRAVAGRSLMHAAAAGLLCGLAALFLQHRAMLVAVTAGAVLLVFGAAERRRHWFHAALVFLAGAMAPVLILPVAWPFALLVDDLIRFPLMHYMPVNRVGPALFLCVSSFVLLAAWVLRRDTRRSVMLLLALQFALLLSAVQRPDATHLTLALFPLLALTPLLPIATQGGGPQLRYAVIWVLAGIVALPLPAAALGIAYRFHLREHPESPVIDYVRQHCGDSAYLYAGPFEPGLHFMAGKLNATHYPFLLTQMHTSEQFEDAAASLREHRPSCAVMGWQNAEKFMHDRHNVVDDFIVANYELAFTAGSREVWRLRSSTHAAR